eukprot:gene13184-13315_t
MGLPDDCPQRALATSSVLWLLISFSLTTALQVWVTYVSMQGAMLQLEKRSSMPRALYCLLAAYAMEAAALLFLTVVTFQALDSGNVRCYTDAELKRQVRQTRLSETAVKTWFIYTAWATVGVVGGLLILLYNLYPDRGLDAWVNRSLQDDQVQDAAAADSAASSTPSQVMRLAKVLGDMFYPLDFSFTDVVAALTLVGITHRSRAAGTGSSSHSHALIAAAAAGLLGEDDEQIILLAGLNQAADGAGCAGGSQTGSAGVSAGDRGVCAVLDQAQQLQVLPSDQALPNTLVATGTAAARALHQHSSTATWALAPLLRPSLAWAALSAAFRGETNTRQRTKAAEESFPASSAEAMHGSSNGNMSSCATKAHSSGRPAPAHVMPPRNDGCKGGSSAGSCMAVSRCSSNGSNSSMAGVAPATTTGSTNSLWELAVRRSSAAALAPGYALKHKSWAGDIEAVHQRSTADLLAADSDNCVTCADPGPSCSQFGRGRPRLSSAGEDAVWAPGGLLVGNAAKRHQLAVMSSGELDAGPGLMSQQAAPSSAPLAVEQLAKAAADSAAAAPVAGSGTPSSAKDQAVQAAATEAALLEAASASADSATFSNGTAVPLELLEEALQWHHYANAVYGWPMFLWSHRYRVLRCCRLCCGRCCTCVNLEIRDSRSTSGGGEGAEAAEVEAGDVPVDDADLSSGSWCNGSSVASAASCSPAASEGSKLAAVTAGKHSSTSWSWSQPFCQRSPKPAEDVNFKTKSRGAAAVAEGVEQTAQDMPLRASHQLRHSEHHHKGGDADVLPPSGGSLTVGMSGDECCWCCGGDWGANHVPKMPPLTASQRLTREAIVQTANIPDADLLHVNYHNLVEGLLPYSVALDVAQQCVVLAIRGSLSVEDCVTDILYDPAALGEDWLVPSAAATPQLPRMQQTSDAGAKTDRTQCHTLALPAAAAGGGSCACVFSHWQLPLPNDRGC